MTHLERGIAISDGGRSDNCTPNWIPSAVNFLTPVLEVLATEVSVVCL